jgi:PTH2 family peptidyl-tRNA hydrolase
MRRGKEIAQGSHASMDFLVSQLRLQLQEHGRDTAKLTFTPEEISWLTAGMAKVCLQVNSEEELLNFHNKALEAGLKSFLIRDSGRTEFNGVPTYTACAIGPHTGPDIDAVTGTLTLY